MPAILRIKNGSFELNLHDSTVYGVREGGLGTGAVADVYAAPYHFGYEPAVDRNVGNRTMNLAVHIKGSTPDDLLTNYRQLASVLRDAGLFSRSQGDEGDRAYVYWKGNGWTNGLYFDLIAGSIPDIGVLQRPFQATSNPMAVWAPVSLMCRPWGRSEALTSVTSGTLNNGGGVANTAATYLQTVADFDETAPARVTLSMGTATRQIVLAGKFRGDPTNFDPVFHCETGGSPYTNYTVASTTTAPFNTVSNTAVAAAQNGLVNRHLANTSGINLTNITLLTWTINKNLHAYRGRYRVYLRIDAYLYVAGNTDLSLQLQWGGAAGLPLRTNDAVNVGSASLTDQLVDLGIISIPETSSPSELARSSFIMLVRYSATTINTATRIDLDCLYLVPIDELYARIDLVTAISDAGDQIVFDFLAQREGMALLGSTGRIKINPLTPYGITRMALLPNALVRWLPLFGNSTIPTIPGLETHNLAATATVKIEYPKLYHHGYP